MYQDRYWHSETFRAVDALATVAERAGRSLASMAFAWLLHHTPTDAVIIGTSRTEQLQQNLALCGEGPLDADTVRECDAVWHQLRGPVPVYNR